MASYRSDRLEFTSVTTGYACFEETKVPPVSNFDVQATELFLHSNFQVSKGELAGKLQLFAVKQY
jgi:hypothetical protein